ncbi:glycosyltransferase [Parabacteroides johnsonii]|uniref:glycosyltransferase n=1 Tax=Parabacteroides johnsonii TaxID=387661 RepID=UPI0021D3593D|nr:glycosyltransferase [Parabacteroides johnsonii]
MCTYNGEKYIRQQLDSILQQTYPIHEIIINDDLSTDGTVDKSSLMMIYQQTELLI